MPWRFMLASCLALTLAVSLSWQQPTQANSMMEFYRCTREPALIEAMGMLATASQTDTVDYLVQNNVRVLFKDMREFGRTYQYNDALSIITDDGHHLIFISNRHVNAPPAALAAIISHEAMHNDSENSINEEYTAWSQESQTWQEMLQRYPQLKNIPVRRYPLVDRLNAISILVARDALGQEIRTNVVYQGLPEHSPGF